MTGSDSEPGVLSEDSDHESERASESSKDAISLREGVSDGEEDNGEESEVDEAGLHQQMTAEELIAGAQAISSDEDERPHHSSNSESRQLSDREEGEDVSSSSSPRKELVEAEEETPAKKQKSSSREDLEDGELTSDSEEEEQEKEVFPKNDHFNKRDHPRIDFPRFQQNHVPQRRRRPEDFGICKFYLRGNCTWDRTCKYAHPTPRSTLLDLERTQMRKRDLLSRGQDHHEARLIELIVLKGKEATADGRTAAYLVPGRKSLPGPPPLALPEVGRRRRRREGGLRGEEVGLPPRSPATTVVLGAGGVGPGALTPVRRGDGERDLRLRNLILLDLDPTLLSSSQRAETTLGALLRKKRLESMQNSESPEKKKSRKKSPSPDGRPQTRDEAIRRLFTKNPDNEPEVYKKRPRKSPTPESISDDGSLPGRRSESPFPASTEV
ncbi:hypothetical protein FO519_002704 [Halicephalobus sp. NKZ332]|nr:hypothetical protein FO519_002704 [Halicephalobus sp. NKZ332]